VWAAGVTYLWNAAAYEDDTCGGATACSIIRCAETGSLTARMCAFEKLGVTATGECMPAAEPTCVEVPFTLPTSSGVRGTI